MINFVLQKGKFTIYKTIFIPLNCNSKDYKYLSKLNSVSAQVWNYCVQINKANKDITGKSLGLSELEFLTKQQFAIHSKGIQHIVFKYYYARNAMWKSIKAKHKESRKVKLPYREKKYMATGWDNQSIKVRGNKIFLTAIKGRKPVICHAKSIPQNIVEIELVYKDKYYLAIKYKEDDNMNLIQSDNSASIDLGETHGITSIDKLGNCVMITNRKIRSLIREKDKRQGELKSLRSKCQKDSRKAKKYTKAIYKIKFEYDNKIKDIIHKQTKLYLNWCIANNVSKVYYGDLDTVTRNSKGRLRKQTNQHLNMWRFGLLTLQLQNKLSRYGIEMVKIDEAYTTRTCPNCQKINKKQSSRNYKCRCGYKQHRDVVGAINILNQNENIDLKRYTNKVYLQIH